MRGYTSVYICICFQSLDGIALCVNRDTSIFITQSFFFIRAKGRSNSHAARHSRLGKMYHLCFLKLELISVITPTRWLLYESHMMSEHVCDSVASSLGTPWCMSEIYGAPRKIWHVALRRLRSLCTSKHFTYIYSEFSNNLTDDDFVSVSPGTIV